MEVENRHTWLQSRSSEVADVCRSENTPVNTGMERDRGLTRELSFGVRHDDSFMLVCVHSDMWVFKL